jgi:hypothetical protein
MAKKSRKALYITLFSVAIFAIVVSYFLFKNKDESIAIKTHKKFKKTAHF